MKPSKAKILATAMMFGAFPQTSQKEYYEGEKHFNKEPKEPIIPKGHIHYWFKANGTFLNEKQSERMLKDECFFKCFALNDKNAIKKFNKFLMQSKS